MAYISSNNNRWYCQVESSYGRVPAIGAPNRFPAVKMSVQQKVITPARHDKTGTRTFPGAPTTGRRETQFDLKTYMTSWVNTGAAPGYGPLFQATLGAAPLFFPGGTATGGSATLTVAFSAPHGLAPGQALTSAGEMRFVVSVIDPLTVLVNAPFTNAPVAGSPIGPTVSYTPTTQLPSISVFDYWSPSTSVQRLLCGAAVDQMSIDVNGDYHEFGFKGMAQDVLDSASFVTNQGQLPAFPIEPAVDPTPINVISGHLGQVWLGPLAARFYTLTSAKVSLRNNLDMRTHEFGSTLPMALNPGMRAVLVDLGLYGQDDTNTIELYQAGRQRSPVGVAIQLGQTSGQLFGMYLKSVVPEVPDYDDQLSRLQWQFRGSQAQGLGDDEIVVAFG